MKLCGLDVAGKHGSVDRFPGFLTDQQIGKRLVATPTCVVRIRSVLASIGVSFLFAQFSSGAALNHPVIKDRERFRKDDQRRHATVAAGSRLVRSGSGPVCH